MTTFNVKIKIQLVSHVVKTIPEISIGYNNKVLETVLVDSGSHSLEYSFGLAEGKSKFYIDFNNKQYSEWSESSDMAIEISKVTFQNLTDDFKHLSLYIPDYPSAEEKLKWDPIIHSNYLGWNGRWFIEFNTPIYRWLHQQLNLGWLI